VIAALSHLFRLGRAGFVLAREGALGLLDPAPLSPHLRLVLRTARLFERRTPCRRR
jgi:ubiquinone biosynthesis protein